MSNLSQQNRFMRISDFSLGEDTFLLARFEGGEYLSDLFKFHITVYSEDLEIKADKVVGKSCNIIINDDDERVWNGFVTEFIYGEVVENNVREYKMVMEPWLWFLTKNNEHRIFQEQTSKDIISQIFQERGFSDFTYRAAPGEVREYCVQYGESDFDFISRIMEEEGVFYYFEHEEDKHNLVIVDEQNSFEMAVEDGLDYSRGDSPNKQVSRWEHVYKFKKGQWSIADYNYKEPSKKLSFNTTTTSKFVNNAKYEHYQYPGLYDYGLGEALVELRMEAEEVGIETIVGESDCNTFYAGGMFELAKHENADEQGEFVIRGVYHKAHVSSYFAGQEGDEGYINSFSCFPADIQFRPQLKTPQPVMQGPQSAIVTGPEGEEIYVDDLGRIKVQFYWDREGENDENTTCFIRVMQTWAGAQWGASFIPRIGHEVIVEFLNGNPDRPLIVGSVYNGKNKPPFDSKTQSGIRTRSTKKGDGTNCNELRFDDKKDDEQILIHAEKNLDTEVENDETHTVDNDRTKHVKNDEFSTIDHDRKKEVKNDQTEIIGKNKTITVGDNHTESIGKDISISIGENHGETIGKNMSITVGKDLSESVGGKYTESVTKEYELSAKSISFTAQDQITLKTGAAQIVMKKNGDITISGKNINVKGSGNVVLKGSKVTAN